jgi:hypothetical protein
VSRLGAAAVGLGLAIVALVEFSRPLGGPGLLDGVLVAEPYRYLEPAGSQLGSPSSAQSTVDVFGATSPTIIAATTEQPPQAQLVAASGAFSLSPGASAVSVTISPVAPTPAQSAAAGIVGNVYRYAVTDQAGVPLAISADLAPSVVLRAPAGTPSSAVVARWDGQAWQQLPTGPGPAQDIYNAKIDAAGDFTLIATGGGSVDLLLLAGEAALVIGVGGLVFLRLRPGARSKPVEESPGKPTTRRVRRSSAGRRSGKGDSQ